VSSASFKKIHSGYQPVSFGLSLDIVLHSAQLHSGDIYPRVGECFCPTFEHTGCTVFARVPGLVA
jgi:hypothetical protein